MQNNWFIAMDSRSLKFRLAARLVGSALIKIVAHYLEVLTRVHSFRGLNVGEATR